MTNQKRASLPEPDGGDAEDLDDGQLVLLLVPLIIAVILREVGRGHDQDAGEEDKIIDQSEESADTVLTNHSSVLPGEGQDHLHGSHHHEGKEESSNLMKNSSEDRSNKLGESVINNNIDQ